MAIDIRDLLRSPRGVAFSKIGYLRSLPEEQVVEFLNGLFRLALESRESGDWEAVVAHIEQWEAAAVAALGARMQAPPVDAVPWAPWERPLGSATVALITTGGVHLTDQTPFNFQAEEGDWSYRELPCDLRQEDVRVAHSGYDISGPQQDFNCVLPLHRLLELERAGRIGHAAGVHYSFMGRIPTKWAEIQTAAREVAERLLAAGVHAAVIGST
ncbi:MAG: hypothetical protein EXR60_04815 [Dehalococcoidia bacterium]|nr:hypothetical protein [Dehalococcoidia bacterium]